METKTDKVKAVRPTGRQDAYGNYSYNVDFENGDSGLFSCKTDQVGSIGLVVGHPFTYNIEKKTAQSGKDWFKISKPRPEFNSGAPKDPNIQNYIIAQSSISSAVQHLQGHGDAGDVIELADKFYKYVLSKKS